MKNSDFPLNIIYEAAVCMTLTRHISWSSNIKYYGKRQLHDSSNIRIKT